ncbi:lysoplasmalogenase [Streptomyces hirsutus]|uniref:lysoplasmalogenase n=1 Tax=Streptomyces hirsutus TaxID=35620 RepID=UPI003317748F
MPAPGPSRVVAEGRGLTMPPLLVAYAGLVLLHLTGVALHHEVLEWVSKPLLAPVLALYLWRRTGRSHPFVLAALILSTAGDVALLLSGTGAFMAGVACFLGAQVCYITAFAKQGAIAFLRARRRWCAGWLVAWAVGNVALAPLLGALMWAVAPYSLALVAMACVAPVRGRRAAWGGALFVCSDLLIGLGAAGLGFGGRPFVVMATYGAAQYLLTVAFAGTSAQRTVWLSVADEDRPCATPAADGAEGPPQRR